MFTKKDRFIVIDTETTNCADKQMLDPIAYDIGWAVVDIDGKVYETRSYIVREVYGDEQFMYTAYFKNKIHNYNIDICSGRRIVKSIVDIWHIFNAMCAEYNVKLILAHNAQFDYRSLNKTLRYLTSSKYRRFIPYGIEMWDTLRWAKEALFDNLEYSLFCEHYGYVTKTKQYRFTAEILYRFLSDKHDFVESHTGLEDVLIEKEIFVYCIQHAPEFDAFAWKR